MTNHQDEPSEAELVRFLTSLKVRRYVGVELLQDQHRPIMASQGELVVALHFADDTQQLVVFPATGGDGESVRGSSRERVDYIDLLTRMVSAGQATWWAGE